MCAAALIRLVVIRLLRFDSITAIRLIRFDYCARRVFSDARALYCELLPTRLSGRVRRTRAGMVAGRSDVLINLSISLKKKTIPSGSVTPPYCFSITMIRLSLCVLFYYFYQV